MNRRRKPKTTGPRSLATAPGRGELRPHPRSARIGRRSARRRSRRRSGAASASTSTRTSRRYYVVPGGQEETGRPPEDARSRRPRSCCWRRTLTARVNRSAGTSAQVLKPNVQVRRIVFHEITEEAVKAALDHPRRTTSTRTWFVRRKAGASSIGCTATRCRRSCGRRSRPGLSAGRVQSVAVRLIVEREEERRAFRIGSYWDLEAQLRGENGEFVATLGLAGRSARRQRQGLRRARRSLKNQNVRAARRGRAATTLVEALPANVPWTVTSRRGRSRAVERPRPALHDVDAARRRRAASSASPPSGRCRSRSACSRASTPADTGGLISYHRTGLHDADQTRRSQEAARVIGEMFGADYYSGPRHIQTRVNATRRKRTKRSGPDRLPSGAESARGRARFRRAEDLRADLEAHDGVADGGRARAADDDGNHRRMRLAGKPSVRRRAARRSSSPVSAAPTSRAATIRQPSSGQEDPAASEGRGWIHRDGRHRDCAARRRRPNATTIVAAGAVHGSVADQGNWSASASAGRPRATPTIATIVRTRLRLPSGQGAGAQLHRVCGHASLLREHSSATSSKSTSPRRWRRTRPTRFLSGEGAGSSSCGEFLFRHDEASAASLPAVTHGVRERRLPAADLGSERKRAETVRDPDRAVRPFPAGRAAWGAAGGRASLPDEISRRLI